MEITESRRDFVNSGDYGIPFSFETEDQGNKLKEVLRSANSGNKKN